MGDMGDIGGVAESGTLDRRSLIKKAALAGGAVWVAPIVLSSRAGAAQHVCYFVKLDAGWTACTGHDPSNGACVDTFNTQSGCGDPRLAFAVTTEGATATVTGRCVIEEMQVKAGTNCNPVNFNSVTNASVTRADSPDGKGISHVSVIYCCPEAGSLAVGP